ncbi:ATP-dependent DNA helicase [Trichonephila clavipes]|nr:ATP-dependent DNA helicase [Trichonephila clavipes]
MTNLGLKTLNVVPRYCHQNDVGGAEYHQRQHLPHHVAHQWLTRVLVETFLPTVLLYGMVTAATMAGYQNLSEFERGVIVGAREMGHSISDVAMELGFSLTTILRMHRGYRESDKTSNLRHRCNRKKIKQQRDQRRLMRIIKRDRRATLLQIATNFNAGPYQQVSPGEPFNETSLIWAFGAECPLVYSW